MAYVLAILNYAVETYGRAKTVLTKVKTVACWDKKIAALCELFDKGVTDTF